MEFEVEVSLIVVCVLVVITNMAVICMVVFIKRLRTFTNYFVLSLAVSDVLMGGVMLPLNHPWAPSLTVTGYVIMFTMLSGVGNICAITWDRYVAVMDLLAYRTKLKKYYWKMLIIIWMTSLSCSLLPLAWQTSTSHIYHKVYIITIMVGCNLLPYVGICTAYIRIFLLLRSHMAQLKRGITSLREREAVRRTTLEGKTVKVFVVVVVLFLLSWVPVFYMSTALTVFQRPDIIPSYLPDLNLLVLGISSLVNPLLYCFMKRDFKRQIRRCLCCMRNTPPVEPSIPMKTTSVQASAQNHGFQ